VFWTATGTSGFKFKDSTGEQGAVKTAQIKLSPGGVFLLKVVLQGKTGPLDIVPPGPGTSGCMAFQIGQDGSGERYSVQFGTESVVRNDVAALLQGVAPGRRGYLSRGPDHDHVVEHLQQHDDLVVQHVLHQHVDVVLEHEQQHIVVDIDVVHDLQQHVEHVHHDVEQHLDHGVHLDQHLQQYVPSACCSAAAALGRGTWWLPRRLR
jgi:hypothetical protein